MIGLLLTGHGRFSEGMVSGLEMIAGKQKSFININFLESESIELFESKMRQAITMLLSESNEVLIGCDLLGGSPFKVAATLSVELGKISVVSGVNLPSLLEVLLTRDSCSSSDELAQAMTESESGGIVKFNMPVVIQKEDPEEGI